MALSAGTPLGAYEVTALIGAGGMGEVYRARDTNLGRQVAIKVLPEAFAQDADRVARFEREAKTLAALNHPNIAQIYGLEKSAGIHALVMELVEGPTLADRIAQGAIPVDEALPIAKQIAEALEAAHEQGIIHRDLKPANVKLRPDGVVKVLDFGLAKALEPPGAMSPGLSQSPTITSPAMTQAGMILGTAAYMSPEQAKGRAVDKRSDIWAFGCVLYEMLVGGRAFPGEAIADSVARIIEWNPDYDALPRDVPPSVRLLMRRCLEKDQRDRLRDIGDAPIEIKQSLATRPANDAYRETREPPGNGAEAVQVLGEQENRRRQAAIEGYKLGGLITTATGVGFGTFLYFENPDDTTYLTGLVPFMVGLVLILYGFVLAPRSARGRE